LLRLPGPPDRGGDPEWDSRLDRLVTPMTGGTGTVTYDYDPAGARVLRTDTTPSGATLTTLTLGDTEIARRADGTTTTRRTYSAGLASVHREVTTTSTGTLTGSPVVRVLAADHHGTTTVAIDARAVGRNRSHTTADDPHLLSVRCFQRDGWIRLPNGYGATGGVLRILPP
jgi:hypothetical protein